MVIKINSKTGLMAAVFVGMILSCSPVQAGVGATVFGGARKVLKFIAKWARISAEVCLVVGGTVAVGAVLDPGNNKYVSNGDGSVKGVIVGLGGSAAVLGLYFLFQEFKSNKKDKVKD